MEQKDSVTAKNHLSKRRKGEHRNCAGRKWLSGSGKRVAHSDPLALISRASLEQRIIFNQLFVSMPGIETKGLYIETKKKKKKKNNRSQTYHNIRRQALFNILKKIG